MLSSESLFSVQMPEARKGGINKYKLLSEGQL